MSTKPELLVFYPKQPVYLHTRLTVKKAFSFHSTGTVNTLGKDGGLTLHSHKPGLPTFHKGTGMANQKTCLWCIQPRYAIREPDSKRPTYLCTFDPAEGGERRWTHESVKALWSPLASQQARAAKMRELGYTVELVQEGAVL